MYTIFLIKAMTADSETAEQLYICGPDGYEITLSPANVTRYCATPAGDLIRYETYNEEIAARLRLDAGFVADKEADVPEDLLNQSKFYVWGDIENPTSGNHAAWIGAGSPEPISVSGPAQIFGPGPAGYMTIEEAQEIIREVIQ